MAEVLDVGALDLYQVCGVSWMALAHPQQIGRTRAFWSPLRALGRIQMCYIWWSSTTLHPTSPLVNPDLRMARGRIRKKCMIGKKIRNWTILTTAHCLANGFIQGIGMIRRTMSGILQTTMAVSSSRWCHTSINISRIPLAAHRRDTTASSRDGIQGRKTGIEMMTRSTVWRDFRSPSEYVGWIFIVGLVMMTWLDLDLDEEQYDLLRNYLELRNTTQARRLI